MLSALQGLGNTNIYFYVDDEDIISHSASQVVVKTVQPVLRVTARIDETIEVTYQVDGNNVERIFPSFEALERWLTLPPVILTECGFSNYFRELCNSVDLLNVYFKVANTSWVVDMTTACQCFVGSVRVKNSKRELYFIFNVCFLRFEADGKMPGFVRNRYSGKIKQFDDETELREWLTTPTEHQSKMLVLCKLDLPLDIKKKLKRYVCA